MIAAARVTLCPSRLKAELQTEALNPPFDLAFLKCPSRHTS